jgi:predicted nucleic acid-binding protein
LPLFVAGCRAWIRRFLRRSSRSAKIVRTDRAARDLTGWPYLDTSALIKLYLPEAGSEELERALLGRSDLLVSDLAVTEAVSALARRYREGALDKAVALRISQSLGSHFDENLYVRVELDRTTHRRAEQLLLESSRGLRAADALHIALALSARAGVLVTFDRRLARAARDAGIATAPDIAG